MLRALERAALGEPLSDQDSRAIVGAAHRLAGPISEAARAVRDRAFGRVVTYSPKVFLPLTNLCRNRCEYCSFRRSPGDPGEWTMTPTEVVDHIERARDLGCAEALFCLGDKPERAFSSYRRTLSSLGQSSTTEYLHWGARVALDRGLLPHTNAGLLDDAEMVRLREVNASLGLMLESSSPRLCEPGMPHHRAPDKRPDRRLSMIESAGRLRIPFTTGILLGIGETWPERVESLLAIRALHRAYRHVQEVIVQPFRAVPGVPMHHAPEPDDADVILTVCIARLILDDDVSLQAPPNLNPEATGRLLAAGLNDFGGISPVTPDYINPRHPWPHIDALGDRCASEGFTLRPRAPIYDRFLEGDEFLDPSLRGPVLAVRARLSIVGAPS